jgi:hypothetical protein
MFQLIFLVLFSFRVYISVTMHKTKLTVIEWLLNNGSFISWKAHISFRMSIHVVLVQKNNSSMVDMSLHSDTLAWFQFFRLLLNAAYLVKKQQRLIL